jgi:hypothetical protein
MRCTTVVSVPGVFTTKVALDGLMLMSFASSSNESVPDPLKNSTYVPGNTWLPCLPIQPHAAYDVVPDGGLISNG